MNPRECPIIKFKDQLEDVYGEVAKEFNSEKNIVEICKELEKLSNRNTATILLNQICDYLTNYVECELFSSMDKSSLWKDTAFRIYTNNKNLRNFHSQDYSHMLVLSHMQYISIFDTEEEISCPFDLIIKLDLRKVKGQDDYLTLIRREVDSKASWFSNELFEWMLEYYKLQERKIHFFFDHLDDISPENEYFSNVIQGKKKFKYSFDAWSKNQIRLNSEEVFELKNADLEIFCAIPFPIFSPSENSMSETVYNLVQKNCLMEEKRQQLQTLLSEDNEFFPIIHMYHVEEYYESELRENISHIYKFYFGKWLMYFEYFKKSNHSNYYRCQFGSQFPGLKELDTVIFLKLNFNKIEKNETYLKTLEKQIFNEYTEEMISKFFTFCKENNYTITFLITKYDPNGTVPSAFREILNGETENFPHSILINNNSEEMDGFRLLGPHTLHKWKLPRKKQTSNIESALLGEKIEFKFVQFFIKWSVKFQDILKKEKLQSESKYWTKYSPNFTNLHIVYDEHLGIRCKLLEEIGPVYTEEVLEQISEIFLNRNQTIVKDSIQHVCNEILQNISNFLLNKKLIRKHENIDFDKAYKPLKITDTHNKEVSLSFVNLKKSFKMLIKGEGGSGKSFLCLQIMKKPEHFQIENIDLIIRIDLSKVKENESYYTSLYNQWKNDLWQSIYCVQWFLQYFGKKGKRILFLLDEFDKMNNEQNDFYKIITGQPIHFPHSVVIFSRNFSAENVKSDYEREVIGFSSTYEYFQQLREKNQYLNSMTSTTNILKVCSNPLAAFITTFLLKRSHMKKKNCSKTIAKATLDYLVFKTPDYIPLYESDSKTLINRVPHFKFPKTQLDSYKYFLSNENVLIIPFTGKDRNFKDNFQFKMECGKTIYDTRGKIIKVIILNIKTYETKKNRRQESKIDVKNLQKLFRELTKSSRKKLV
ncbi:DgyrCDS14894 [Dimorphilus gyrociliatus]|uniref:DgyrCDS14894 n=1 Tax=Dimorphilus gyrociliatus TaxID=2664684 RepID=A0A7I8WF89_9ANNE|nr:DgyrCDS14894 [Dimorphilus gyrociliatus]